MFEKLLKASGTLSPSVTKLLHKAGLPVGNVSLTNLFYKRLKKFDFFVLFRRKRTFKINKSR